MENASLLDDTFNFQHVASLYPADVILRARAYRNAGVVIGAYSASQGVPIVRDEVAQYITGEAAHVWLGRGGGGGRRGRRKDNGGAGPARPTHAHAPPGTRR